MFIVDHVDITQLEDIKVEFPIIYSNAYSIGFWIYISNEGQLGDHLININLNKIMTVSIGLDNHFSTICNLYTNSYQNLLRKDKNNPVPQINDIKTMTEMKDLINNPNYVNKQSTFTNDMSDKWLYTRCGYSSDAKDFYNMIMYNSDGGSVVVGNGFDELKNIYYYNNSEVDFPSRYFFDRDASYLTIENANTLTTVNTQIYLRNINIFTELVHRESRPQYL